MQARSGLQRRWSGRADSSGGAEAGVVGSPGLGQGSHHRFTGWDLASPSTVESEIESRWGRAVGLAAQSEALGL